MVGGDPVALTVRSISSKVSGEKNVGLTRQPPGPGRDSRTGNKKFVGGMDEISSTRACRRSGVRRALHGVDWAACGFLVDKERRRDSSTWRHKIEAQWKRAQSDVVQHRATLQRISGKVLWLTTKPRDVNGAGRSGDSKSAVPGQSCQGIMRARHRSRGARTLWSSRMGTK